MVGIVQPGVCSGGRVGARRTSNRPAGFFRLVPPNTLLGPEATGPAAPVPVRGVGVPASCRSRMWRWGVVVVAPSWWWGVVFDLWIVVASIKPHVCPVGFFPGRVVLFVVV